MASVTNESSSRSSATENRAGLNFRVFASRRDLLSGIADSIRQLSRKEVELRVALLGFRPADLRESLRDVESRISFLDSATSTRADLTIVQAAGRDDLPEELDTARLFVVVDGERFDPALLEGRYSEIPLIWFFMLDEMIEPMPDTRAEDRT